MIPKRDQNPTPLLREVPRHMPRLTPSEEVRVLRFFEQAPYDKAETMLHIVCDKMRERKPVSTREERPGRKNMGESGEQPGRVHSRRAQRRCGKLLEVPGGRPFQVFAGEFFQQPHALH